MARQRLVLVVDDSENDLFLLKRGFEKAGVSVALEWVQSGEEAVSYLLREAALGLIPSLMLLDIKMPGMGGFSVLDWLKTQTNLKAMPTLMLSGSNLESDKDLAKALGARDYFMKPTDPQDYIKLGKTWLALG